MSDDAAASRVNGTTPTADQLEADLERQRQELASTVDALQAKLDVKARARHKAEDLRVKAENLRARATDEQGRPRPELVAAGVAALALLAGLVALRSRRPS
jgi:hypothetical protein